MIEPFTRYVSALIITLSFASSGLAQDQIVNLPNGKKVVLHSDKTWEYYEGLTYDFDFSILRDNQIPNFLRQGISVNKQTLVVASEMYLQGWRYIQCLGLKVHKQDGGIMMEELLGGKGIGTIIKLISTPWERQKNNQMDIIMEMGKMRKVIGVMGVVQVIHQKSIGFCPHLVE